MPMEETPFEQLVVALATKWTGEESTLLFPGEETDTPANEHTDSANTQTRVFICTPANWPRICTITRTGAGKRTFRNTVPSRIGKHFKTSATYVQSAQQIVSTFRN